MSRAFTRREKLMLGILTLLILVATYYFFAFQPMQARILAAETRSAEAQDALLIEQARATMRSKMLAEIEQMKADGAQTNAEIPDFNNLRSVMLQLNAILASAKSYDIGFSNVDLTERIVTRPLQITFTANNYAEAKLIVLSLAQCRYRCTIDSADVTVEALSSGAAEALPDVNTQPIQMSLNVTFYEKNTTLPTEPPAETPPAA